MFQKCIHLGCVAAWKGILFCPNIGKLMNWRLLEGTEGPKYVFMPVYLLELYLLNFYI